MLHVLGAVGALTVDSIKHLFSNSNARGSTRVVAHPTNSNARKVYLIVLIIYTV